jgi:hypothetical protein
MVDSYFTNSNETSANKALQMHAFGIAAEARIDSATTRQEVRDELNLIWERMREKKEGPELTKGVKNSSKRSREIGPDDVSIHARYNCSHY